MIISVTERDIRLGRKYHTSNTRCPVARALHRAGLKRAHVGVSWFSLKPPKKREDFRTLPPGAINFINALINNREDLEPFSFRIKVA